MDKINKNPTEGQLYQINPALETQMPEIQTSSHRMIETTQLKTIDGRWVDAEIWEVVTDDGKKIRYAKQITD